MKNKIKNGLIKVFFTLIKRWNKPFLNSKNSYLIVSTTGLGDTLWATPAIRVLKQKNPDSKIFLLCTNFSKEVLKTNPRIDKIFTLKNPFSLIHFLRKEKIHTIYIFHSSQRITLPICAMIKAQKIIGFEKNNKGLDFLLTTTIKKEKLHEIDQRLNLIGAYPEQDRFMEFYVEKNISSPLLDLGIDLKKPIIGIHPGAKDSYKCWPKQYFIETANQLLQKKDCQILISAGKEEKNLQLLIAEKIPGCFYLPHNLQLHHFAKAIEKMSVLICNDTGPMHLAAALNIPVIAPFAPTSSFYCGPIGKNKAIAIQKPVTCTPCLKRKCKDSFCLLQISPSMVIDQVLTILDAYE